MPKEKKRTYHAETTAPEALRLTPRPSRQRTGPVQAAETHPRGQFFPPELIQRLAERIRKL